MTNLLEHAGSSREMTAFHHMVSSCLCPMSLDTSLQFSTHKFLLMDSLLKGCHEHINHDGIHKLSQ